MSGWIKLHRQIRRNPLFKEKRKFSKFEAWIDMLLEANHCNKTILLGNELIEVKRGCFITSELKLANRWGWSRTKVRSFLKILSNESDPMIVKKSDSKKTSITIVNYDIYQDAETTNQTSKEHQKNIKKTSKKHQKNTTKNDKNDKNVKNDKNNIAASPPPPKKNYAEFVKLTEEEYNRLIKQYGRDATDTMIEILDNYKGSTGKKYKDDNRAIRSWVVKRYEDDKAKGYLRKNKDEPKAWDTLREWLEEKEAGEKHYDL
jgi:hypothetical protein